jgi:hypothetical protein
MILCVKASHYLESQCCSHFIPSHHRYLVSTDAYGKYVTGDWYLLSYQELTVE